MMNVNDYLCVNACNKIRIVNREDDYKVIARVNYFQNEAITTNWDNVNCYNSVIRIPEQICNMKIKNIAIFDNETITLYVE